MREYDGRHDFRLKYPLATIHMLMGIIGSRIKIEVPQTAIRPLFFTDGTYNVLFRYPENVLNWLKFLRANEDNNPLKNVFENTSHSVFSIMNAMDEFFRRRDEISVPNERGDRMRISLPNGDPFNIQKTTNGLYKLNDNAVDRVVKFMKILSELTEWKYKLDDWTWEDFNLYRFTKKDFSREKRRINGSTFNEFMAQNPLTWAMTSGQNIEYTLEEPDKLP